VNYRNRYTGTEPIVFHAPGRSRRRRAWGELQRHAPAACVRHLKTEPEENFALITWNTSDTESVLEQCLNAMNCPHTVLGRGKPDWQNRDKTRLAIDAVSRLDADIIIGLDAWDVALIAHPDEIVRRFRVGFRSTLPILFNGGPHPWPAVDAEPELFDVTADEFHGRGIARHLHGPRAQALQLGYPKVTVRNARKIARLHQAWRDGHLHTNQEPDRDVA